MYSLIFRTLLLLWPFLKRAILGDRSLKEALLKNKLFNLFFVVIVILCLTIVLTLKENNNIKRASEVLRSRDDDSLTTVEDLTLRKLDLNIWLN